MRRLVLVAAAFALTALPATAGERSSWYASVEGGINEGSASTTVVGLPLGGLLGLGTPAIADTSVDPGWAIAGTVGVRLNSNVRLEGEYSERTATLGGRSSIDNATLMLNALVELPVSDSFSLAFGGGLGADWISADQSLANSSHSATSFAFQLIGEGSLALNDNLDLTLSYRHLETSSLGDQVFTDVDYSTGGSAAVRIDDVSSDTVSIGLRFAL